MYCDLTDESMWDDVLNRCIDKSGITTSVVNYYTKKFRDKVINQINTGTYEFSIPTEVRIPKSDGKFRTIWVHDLQDRIVLSLISKLWYKKYGHLISDRCFSYKERNSISTTLKLLKKEVVVPYEGIKLDLKAYFDEVPKRVLFETLDTLTLTPEIDCLIKKLYASDTARSKAGDTISVYMGLMQGCPLSPFLSNYILSDVDRDISKYNIKYYRYADDILILGDEWKPAFESLKKQLSMKELRLNEKKTMRVTSVTPYKFLGFNVHGNDIRLSSDKWEKFKTDINKFCKYSKYTKVSKVISTINNYLFCNEHKRIDLIFNTVTSKEDITEMDRYVKSRVRYSVTGKNNSVHNCNKVPDSMLRENGYVSLVMLYDINKQGADVFNQFLDVEVL